MRVMMTTDTVGGVWTFTSELTQGLLAAGHELSLLSLGRLPDQQQLQWTRDLSHRFPARFRYTASDAPLEWMDNNAHCRKETCAVIEHALHGFDADLIHANQFAVAQHGTSIPTLLTIHSDILSWAEACQPEGLSASPWRDTALDITRYALHRAGALVAPTRWMAAAIIRLYHLPCEPIVIPNGRDLTFAPTDRKLQAVTAGRLWDPAKGLGLLPQLNSARPILVAGELRHAAASAPTLSPEITALGPLSSPELTDLFASSSLYLATSLYEPFGLAPLEAALCGCAILARDIPSLREVWAGAALYFHDAPSLQRLLQQLLDSPAALAQAQARSIARARRYTRTAMTAAYLNAYDALLLRNATAADEALPEPAHAL